MQFYILDADLTNRDIFMCIGEYKSVEFIYGIESYCIGMVSDIFCQQFMGYMSIGGVSI